MDLTGVTGDAKSYYAYAVDSKGMPTLLGPVMIENGIGKAEFSTPMNQFMIVLSPTEGVTSFSSDVPVTFRSAVPTGYAVVPVATTSNGASCLRGRRCSRTRGTPSKKSWAPSAT